MNYLRYVLVVILLTNIIIIKDNVVMADNAPRIEFNIEHETEVYPWTPIIVKLTIENRGDHDIFSHWFPSKGVEMTLTNEDGQQIYKGSSIGTRVDERDRQVIFEVEPDISEFKVGESQNVLIILKSRWGGRWNTKPDGALFQESGVYTMVLKYGIIYSSTKHGNQSLIQLESKPLNVRIKDVGEYKDAFKGLDQLTENNILLEPDHLIYSIGGEPELLREWDSDLDAFLTDHGDSPWAPLAWLARAHIAGSRKDYQNQLDYAERAVETAETHEIDYTRRRALELKEHALRQLGQTERAREIGRQLQDEERERRGLEPIPPPDPDDDHNKAMWEFEKLSDRLEDEGYDPRGLREVAPAAWEEYHQIEEALWAKYLNQELKAGEFYRQRGAALERITREHTEPIPQEELRERIRLRTEERERRTREASERFNRWREENPEEFEEMLRRMEEDARRGRQPNNEDD